MSGWGELQAADSLGEVREANQSKEKEILKCQIKLDFEIVQTEPNIAVSPSPENKIKEKEAEKLGESKVSPLKNPLQVSQVLLKIFGFCSISDLGRFRLVSKQWNNVSSPIWSIRGCVIIKASLVGRSEIALSKFLDYIEGADFSLDKNPLQRFKLDGVHFCGEVGNFNPNVDGKYGISEDSMSRLFRLCGPQIRYLELSNYVVVNFSQFHGALTRSTPMLESLTLKYSELMRGARHNRTFYSYVNEAVGKVKQLRIEVLDDKDYDKNVYLEFPFYWIQLFSWFPYVECLDIRCGEDNLQFNIVEMFRDMKILRDQRKLEFLKQLYIHDARGNRKSHEMPYKMKNLTINSIPNINLLESLKNSELVLKTLALDLPSQHFEHKLIRKILERFGPHLVKLDVRHVLAQNTELNSTFPYGIRLHKLEELYVSYRQCPDLRFSEDVPNLKILSVCRSECRCTYFNDFDSGGNISEDVDFEANDYSHVYTEDDYDNGLVEDIMEAAYKEVGELQDWERNIVTNTIETNPQKYIAFEGVTVFRLAYWCNQKEMRKLTNWLPSVVKLSMPLGNATFQVVCDRWSNLGELTVLEQYLGKQCLDGEGITGIRKNAVYPFYPDMDQRLPNITYLKHLRIFRVKNKKCDFVGVGKWWESCQPQLSFLTDEACQEGFLQLPNLQFLEVNVKISGYTAQQLFRRIPTCILHRKIKLRRKPSALALSESHYDILIARKNNETSCPERKQRYFVTLKNFCS